MKLYLNVRESDKNVCKWQTCSGFYLLFNYPRTDLLKIMLKVKSLTTFGIEFNDSVEWKAFRMILEWNK